jgi:hypothetical protein
MFTLRQWISCITLATGILATAILAGGCAQHSSLSRSEESQTPQAQPPAESVMAQRPAKPADTTKKSGNASITTKPGKQPKRKHSAANPSPPVSKPVAFQYPSITLDNPFKLKYGQNRRLPDSDLYFKISKFNDSRCPMEMHCPQQGTAEVTLTLYRNDKRIDVLKISADDLPFTISDRRITYHIRLLELQPYPTVQFVDIKHYVAELVVTKAKAP